MRRVSFVEALLEPAHLFDDCLANEQVGRAGRAVAAEGIAELPELRRVVDAATRNKLRNAVVFAIGGIPAVPIFAATEDHPRLGMIAKDLDLLLQFFAKPVVVGIQ